MSEFIWRHIARFCAKPAVTRLLIRLAMKQPYLHIGDYMLRYWLIPFSWGLPFSVRLHHIKRPDAETIEISFVCLAHAIALVYGLWGAFA